MEYKLFLGPIGYTPDFYNETDEWDITCKVNDGVDVRYLSLGDHTTVRDYGKSIENLILRSKKNRVDVDENIPTNDQMLFLDADGIERAQIDCSIDDPISDEYESPELKSFVDHMVLINLTTGMIVSPYKSIVGKPENVYGDFPWELFINHYDFEGVEYINEHSFKINGEEFTDSTIYGCPTYIDLFINLANKMFDSEFIFFICEDKFVNELHSYFDRVDFGNRMSTVNVICV